MADVITNLTDMVNVPVVKSMLQPKEILKKSKWAGLCKIDTEALTATNAGDTIKIPFYNYIGDMDELTEGVDMDSVVLTTGSKDYAVKSYGKSVILTKEAMVSGFGDPVGNVVEQLKKSAANKLDKEIPVLVSAEITDVSTAAQYLNYVPAVAEAISYDLIVDAAVLYGQDEDGGIVVIHPAQKAEIRKSAQFEIINDGEKLMSGVIGRIAGYQVVVSDAVEMIGADATERYVNFLMKPEAITIFFKQEAEVGTLPLDAAGRKMEFAADIMFVPAVVNKQDIVRFESDTPATA